MSEMWPVADARREVESIVFHIINIATPLPPVCLRLNCCDSHCVCVFLLISSVLMLKIFLETSQGTQVGALQGGVFSLHVSYEFEM